MRKALALPYRRVPLSGIEPPKVPAFIFDARADR
jgi:hypothetical protein